MRKPDQTISFELRMFAHPLIGFPNLTDKDRRRLIEIADEVERLWDELHRLKVDRGEG